MTYFFILVAQSVWFSLPMYAANMIPVLVKRVPFLDFPIDMGKTFRGKPIFGSHKTLRGFVFGVSSAMLVAYIQKMLFLQGGSIWVKLSIIDYDLYSFVLFGFLLGFGALVGDAVESFFKRQVGILSGEPWLVFDQIDYAIGALIFVSILYVPPIPHIIIISTIGLFGSFVSSYIGYYIGFKDSKV